MTAIQEQRTKLIDSARSIIENAKGAGRDLTPSEATQVSKSVSDIKALDERISISQQGEAALKMFGELPGETAPGIGGYLDLGANGRRRLGAKFAQAMTGVDGAGRKALLPAGEQLLPIPVLPSDPLSLAKDSLSLLSVLPTVQIPQGALANYVRQGSRTNNASAVAPGAAKPESQLALTPIALALKIYATLSEAVDKFLISDSTVLSNWIAQELLYCVIKAVETDVLTGDPTANPASIRGLLNTSGIVVVPFTSNLLTSLRAAKTSAEQLGYDDGLVYALSAADWSAAEQARASGGTYDFPSAPGEAAPKMVWGVPVVTVTGLPAKTAVLINRSSLAIYSDSAGIKTEWGSPSDTWTRNQVVARTEGRFDLAVYQPNGIVKIGTAA